MKVRWSYRAREDRRNLVAYIENESALSAFEVDVRIDEALYRLADYPHSGRPGRAPGTRELVIPRTPYVAIYLLDDQGVRIVRLIHGAQRWPPADGV